MRDFFGRLIKDASIKFFDWVNLKRCKSQGQKFCVNFISGCFCKSNRKLVAKFWIFVKASESFEFQKVDYL